MYTEDLQDLAIDKDVAKSCIFDYPDRPPDTLPPGPFPIIPPPCFPWCPSDDWPPPPPPPPAPLPVGTIQHGSGFTDFLVDTRGRFSFSPDLVINHDLFVDTFGTLTNHDNFNTSIQYFGFISVVDFVASLSLQRISDLLANPTILKRSYIINFATVLSNVPAIAWVKIQVDIDHQQFFFQNQGGNDPKSTQIIFTNTNPSLRFQYVSPSAQIAPYIMQLQAFIYRGGNFATYCTVNGSQIFPLPYP